MRSALVIPARFASTRFPGKPLVNLLGKPMVQWVWERCCLALDRSQIFVATDDDRIEAAVKSFGANVLRTASSCLTGTDRVAEAALALDADCIVNVQGDEPLVDPAAIKLVLDKFSTSDASVLNAMSRISDVAEYRSPNVPKVVFSESRDLMYMSRAPIPASKDGSFHLGYKQVCIYAFSPEALSAYAARTKKSEFESVEDIEILRFLEMGLSVKMVEVAEGSVAVDIPEDVEKAERLLRRS